ncbi:MAG: hypothetical protein DMF90_27915 [Acidobacteria bacterium]|nr:MAG: hypothetical protein DMF90_27915 [Acidobacteriota bacterium]
MSWWAFWRPPCLRRVVLVSLVSDKDTAIRGVLWESRGVWFTVRNAAAIKARAAPLPMDGEVVIHRANVAFFQVLPE